MTTAHASQASISLEQFHEKIDRLRQLLNSVLKGKAEVVEDVLVCLLAQGHLLIEDQPGLGKTTLAKALATGLGERFARIQCTPDLLPSDITGFNIFNQKSNEFEFREGPVFSDVLLADEINRATPRTQSALLEAMAERQVTIDSNRYQLSSNFFVIATQNPIEQHGTYPLPEAQLDRFALKLSIGYPAADDEINMLDQAIAREQQAGTQNLEAVFSPGEIEQLQTEVQRIHVGRNVQEYIVNIGKRTREHPRIHLGLSPRGLLVWQRCAQAHAFLANRDFVTPDDLQAIAGPVLEVRLGVDDTNPKVVISQIMDETPVPTTPSL